MIIRDAKMNRYFDKNGNEINEGDFVKYPDGRIEKVYVCGGGNGESYMLGTDATNPAWIRSGRAVPCEYGVYPFGQSETLEIEVVKGEI